MTDTSRSDGTDLSLSNTPDQDSTDYEAKAREMGWRPEGEFKGAKEHFVDAKTFYERGQTVLTIIQAENLALRDEIARIGRDASKALEVSERAHARELAEAKAELELAKAARKEAVDNSDGAAFTAADERVKELEDVVKTPPPAKDTPPPLDPRYTAWLDRSDLAWFKGDEEAQAMADGMVKLPKYRPLLNKAEELWDAVAKDIKKIRDAQATSSRADRERPGPEGGGKGNGSVRTGTGARSFDNLTQEFQKECDRQYKSFYGGSKTITLEKWRERYVSGIAQDAFRK